MRSTKSASRYAKALIDLALEQNKIDKVAQDLKYLYDLNEQTKEFEVLLKSPVVHVKKKIEIFEKLFTQFDPLTDHFVKLITNNRREYMLPHIAIEFEAQLKAMNNITPITIVSASPLNSSTKEAILKQVKAAVNGELEVTEEVDPAIIGGFIVNMDNKRIDASVLGQINKLKQSLTR